MEEVAVIAVLTIVVLLWAVKVKLSSKSDKFKASTEMCDEVPMARSSVIQNLAGGQATVVDLLKFRSNLHPFKVLHIFLDDQGVETKRITFGDMDLGARKVAAMLQTKANVNKGDRVILCYPPGLEFAVALWGCLYAGAIAIPVYPPYPGTLDRDLPKFNKLVSDSGATVVLTNRSYALASKMGTLKSYFGSSVTWPKNVSWFQTDNLADSLADKMIEVNVTPSDMAFFQYSSGSTSSPKAVMVSHRNVRGQLRMWESLLPSTVMVSWLPTYHDMGLVGFILVPMFTAACCVSMSPLSFIKDPALWLRIMHKYRGNLSCAPNFGYALVARKVSPAERATFDLSPWTEAVCAAEPIRADVLRTFTTTFAPCGFRPSAFNCGYGLAETTLTLTGRDPDVPSDPVVLYLSKRELEVNQRAVDVLTRSFQDLMEGTEHGGVGVALDPAEVLSLVGCGVAAPGQTVLIVDPETHTPLPDNVVGEIWGSGSSVAEGYYGREEQTAEAFKACLAGGSAASSSGSVVKGVPSAPAPLAAANAADVVAEGETKGKGKKKKKKNKKKGGGGDNGGGNPAASATPVASASTASTSTGSSTTTSTGEGYLRTGDLGFMRGGVLFVTGRLKDLIIVRGRNILPQDIELTVEACHASVRPGCSAAFAVEVAVEAAGGGGGGAGGGSVEERLVVVAELRTLLADEGARREVVRSIQTSIFSEHQLPCHAVVLLRPRCIPKTTSGKIQRHASKLGFLEGSLKTQHTAFFRSAAAHHAVPPSPSVPANVEPAAAATAASAATSAVVVVGKSGGGKRKRKPKQKNKKQVVVDGDSNSDGVTSGVTSSDSSSSNGGDTPPPTGPTRTPPEIEAWLCNKLEGRMEGGEGGEGGVDPHTSWAALGLDSIALVTLSAELGDWLGVVVPPSALFDYDSVHALAHAPGLPTGSLPGGGGGGGGGGGSGTAPSYQPHTAEHVSGGDGGAGAAKVEGGGAAGAGVDAGVPRAMYDVTCFPEYVALKDQMALLEGAGLAIPYLQEIDRSRPTLNYNTYNYLGLANGPELVRAAKAAVDEYGTSMCSSPIVGQNTLNLSLEAEICAFTGAPAAVVFIGGWQTNVSTIAALAGPGDLVLCDALAHNCCVVGAKLSGAAVIQFPHNDARQAERILCRVRPQYRRVLLLIEGCYSMDGDVPDLPRFVDMKRRHGAILFVDEAHSLGTLGATGRGVAEYHGLPMDCVDVRMGTLSKAFGSCGGFISGSAALVELLKFTAGGFVFSVGIAPAAAGAATRSLQLAGGAEGAQRVAKLQANAAMFLRMAKAAGLDTGVSHDSPVIPIVVGSTEKTVRLSHALAEQHAINVKPIVYPAVEERQARLRFFISASLSREDITRTVSVLVTEARKLGIPLNGASSFSAVVPPPQQQQQQSAHAVVEKRMIGEVESVVGEVMP